MSTDTEDKTYNGWANYETWVINMWLSNDEGIYEETNGIIEQQLNEPVITACEALKDFVEELAEATTSGVLGGSSFVTDLFQGALSEVDWREVVTNWVEGMYDLTIEDGTITQADR